MIRILPGACALILISPFAAAEQLTASTDAQSLTAGNITVASLSSIDTATTDFDDEKKQDIDDLFELYESVKLSGIQDEADTLAKRIVNASIESNGLDSKVTALALVNLAMLQSSNEEYVSSVQNFLAAINIVENVDDRLSPDLIAPLKGLGNAHVRSGDAARARNALNRALHISHVNFGPHNYAQIETLFSIARLFAKAGMSDEAYKVRKRISYLHMRNSKRKGSARLPAS